MAQSVTNLNNGTFTEGSSATIVDSDVTVSGDDNFTGGYLIFDLQNSASVDNLSLVTGGSLTRSGDYIYWNGSRIGKISSTYNGLNGADLRIDFSAETPVPNSGYETGDITNWTSNTAANQMCNQSWSEGPIGFSGDGDPKCDDSGPSGTFEVSSAAAHSGSYGLKLAISGQVDTDCGTAHSPSVISNTFAGNVGDELSLWYNAAKTSDYSDCFGFVFSDSNSNGSWDSGEPLQRLFHRTVGTTNGWINLNTTLTVSGTNLRFWFLNGTFDQTCGQAVGSYLYIDDIVLQVYNASATTTGQVATNAIVEYIIEHIAFQSSCGTNGADRNFQITVNDGSGSGSASAYIDFVTYAPNAVCKNLTVYLDASGNGSISESAVNNGSTDNCSMTYDTDVTSFTCADLPTKTVTLSVTDSYGNVGTCQSTITFCDAWAPVANADSYYIYYSESGNVAYTLNVNNKEGVLSNDTDQPCTVQKVNSLTDDADHGELTLNTDGSFSYKPDQLYRGTDIFRYNVSDGCNTSSAATVTIYVTTPIFTNANGTGLFSDPLNWNCGYVPSAENLDIIIAAGTEMQVNQDYTCRNLQFLGGATFVCTGGHTLTITDNILNKNGDVITNNTGIAIDINSSLKVKSSIQINNP